MACCQPYRPLIPATLIRADTRDPRRSMNPLTGIWPACATVPGYRYVSPNGERHHPAAIVHCSLYIVHCSYTFSAKEKDSETGLSYFGSRYYSSDLSIWLSVDPMCDKYPSTSPYAYCRNNPIILVDDNGNKDRPFNPGKIGYSISNYFTCYNCHSYAWNNSLGSKYSKAVNYLGLALSGGGAPFGIDFIQNYAYVLPRWNNDPTNDILEQGARQMLNTENNQVGDRVIYYYDENGSEKYEPGEPIVHSAIVEEVDVNGYTTLVKAKCGEGPITVNHPDAPNYYSTYKDPAGESHKTRRAYFRIPATNNQQEPYVV